MLVSLKELTSRSQGSLMPVKGRPIPNVYFLHEFHGFAAVVVVPINSFKLKEFFQTIVS